MVAVQAARAETAADDTPPPRRRRRRLLDYKKDIPLWWKVALGLLVWALFFALWQLAIYAELAVDILLPGPLEVLTALRELFLQHDFATDIGVSVARVLASFALALLVAVPLGILMGAFPAVEAFFNPLVSGWRYLPAPSFIPLLLMWLGAGEAQKLALLFIGVLWFLITLIMDHTKSIPAELIHTARTLGGNRRQILWTVVVPATLPGIVVIMRQMLAVSWTYLVIAEIVAANSGIGAMMMRAKRFIHVDQIMAGILVIGLLGLLFDFLLRQAHRRAFRYLEENS